MATEFIEELPAIDIRDKIVFFVWRDGRKCGMPLRIGRLTSASLVNALNEHDRGNVFDFPRPKRGRKPKGEAGSP